MKSSGIFLNKEASAGSTYNLTGRLPLGSLGGRGEFNSSGIRDLSEPYSARVYSSDPEPIIGIAPLPFSLGGLAGFFNLLTTPFSGILSWWCL